MKIKAKPALGVAVSGGIALIALAYAVSIFTPAVMPWVEVVIAAAAISGAILVFVMWRGRMVEGNEYAVLDAMPDEVWLITRHTLTVSYVNARGLKRTGFDFTGRERSGPDCAYPEWMGRGDATCVGTSIWKVLPTEWRGALHVAFEGAALEGPEFGGAEVAGQDAPRLRVLRDADHVFEPTVRAVRGGTHILLVLRDVTQELAEEKVKSDFISTVSHEMRSPLTSIKGSMGLLLSNAVGDIPPSARGLLEIAHRNSERLVLIINDILDLQKIVDGGMEFNPQQIDAAALVHEATAASSFFLNRFDLEIEVCGADRPVIIYSDPNRIIQVLGNLLSNAAKFSKPHGKITVSLVQLGDHITVSVRDTGVGIPAAEHAKIFARFADLSNSERARMGGSGLGLSICKAIVEKLDGSIGFESVEGVGTVFHIRLPCGVVEKRGTGVIEQVRHVG